MIDRMIMIPTNLVDTADSIVASDELVSMPVTNLQDDRRNVPWRASAAAIQTIDIVMISGVASRIAFIDHNLSVNAIINVKVWNDAINGNVLEVNFNVDIINLSDYYINNSSLSPVLVGRSLSGYPFGTSYMRITLQDNTIPYYQIGRLFIGQSWTAPVNMSFGSSINVQDNTKWKKTANETEIGNIYPSNLVIDFSFDWVDEVMQDSLWRMLLTIGFNNKFILQMRPENGDQSLYLSLYGRFIKRSMVHSRVNNAPFKLTFKETN